MAVNPSSLGGPKPQFELSDGTPAVGCRLFFYVGGSVNTKQNTYTDSTGGSANTNPIVLNALGMPTTEIWFTAGLSYKVVYAPPGSDDPPNSPIFTVDNLRGINDTSVTISQWVASGITPTFVSTTSFTLPGDQTTEFHPGRRILTTNTGGSVYSYIVTSVFGALTTVTVVNDGAGVLDSGLSAVSYGLLTTDNPSTPLLTDAYPVVSGSADKTKKLRFEVDGLTTATTRVGTVPDYNFRIGNLPAGIGPLPYAGSSIPTGWLECDGSAVSRTTYADLFTAIGTTWGAGDGVNTFNLPPPGRVAIGDGTATVVEAVTASSGNGFTVAANNTKWITGMTVVVSNLTGFGGSVSAATLYAVRISSTNVRLASTLALAQGGSPDITITGTGTATLTTTFTARTLGEQGGEEGHAMSSTELLAHTHTGATANNANSANGAGTYGGPSLATGSAGGNAAANIMQPFIVTKMIISY